MSFDNPKTYEIAVEPGQEVWAEMQPILIEHYEEIRQRQIAEDDYDPGPYNPRHDQYMQSFLSGHFVMYIMRFEGQIVGYYGAWLTHDMTNSAYACNDAGFYVTPDHRKGSGRKLLNYAIKDMRERGVTNFNLAVMDDMRLEKLLTRMGFVRLGVGMRKVLSHGVLS